MPKLKRIVEKRQQTEKQKNISNAGKALAYAKWENEKKRPEYLLQLEKARKLKEVYKGLSKQQREVYKGLSEQERKVQAKKDKKARKEYRRKTRIRQQEAEDWVNNIEKEQIKKIAKKKKDKELAIAKKKKEKELAKMKIKKKPPKQDDLFGNKETQDKAESQRLRKQREYLR